MGPSLRSKRSDRDPIQSSNRWPPEKFEMANGFHGQLPISNTPGPPPISSEDHCLKRLGALVVRVTRSGVLPDENYYYPHLSHYY